MREAKRQMQVYLTRAERQTWKVNMRHLVCRANGLLFQPGLRKADHRAARLEVTAQLLGRDVPLGSYNDLTADERRALILFMREMPDEILAEVREAYAHV